MSRTWRLRAFDFRVESLIALTLAASLAMGCVYSTSTPGDPIPPVAPALQNTTSDGAGALTVAPAPAISTRLGLEDLLLIAGRENPSFASFQASREAARAAVVESLAWPNPELEVDVTSVKPRGLAKVEGAKDEWEYGIGVVQPLEWPTKRKTRLRAAQAFAPIAEMEEIAFRVDLRAEVTQAYYNALYRIAALDLAWKNKVLADEIAETVKGRVDAGGAAAIDEVKARVDVLKSEREIQQQSRHLKIWLKALNALCGRALPADFTVEGSLEELPALWEAGRTDPGAMEGHPKIVVQQAIIRQRGLEVKKEEAAWHPDLKPGFAFGREPDQDNFTGSLGVEVPLWNRNQGGIARAKAEVGAARAELEKTRSEIWREVETAGEGYASARDQASAFTELRAAAGEVLRTDNFLYQQGEVDFLRLLDARRTAQQTEAEYLNALLETHLARADLDKALGSGVDQP